MASAAKLCKTVVQTKYKTFFTFKKIKVFWFWVSKFGLLFAHFNVNFPPISPFIVVFECFKNFFDWEEAFLSNRKRFHEIFPNFVKFATNMAAIILILQKYKVVVSNYVDLR